MGFVAAFAVVILLTAGIYLFGYAIRRSSLLHVLFLETFIGLVLIFPLLLLADKLSLGQIFTNLHRDNWLWLGAAALFGYAGGNYFSLMNLKNAGVKSNSLLSPAITSVTILLSIVVFKEKLLWLQWLGILITLGAVVYFLLQSKNTGEVENYKKGLVSGVLTILCISATIICSVKGAAENVSFLQAIWIRLLVAFIILLPFVFYAGFNKNKYQFSGKFYAAVIGAVICQTILANYLWLYASFHIGISVFQVILATLPLCVYAVEVFILKKAVSSGTFLLVSVISAVGVCLVVYG